VNSTNELSSTALIHNFRTDSEDLVKSYFSNFEALAKSENWNEIISQGTKAIAVARKEGKTQDEAKISAQLTSSCFYLGDYTQALLHATRCHELSETFVDPTLIRALYLESAVFRALAPKENGEEAQQAMFLRAVSIAEEAEKIYNEKRVNDLNLLGKVFFNMGAAHADNPKDNLEKAVLSYAKAIDSFMRVEAREDVIRTSIRLAKVYLLQQKFELSQQIINEARPQITNERLAMHMDYLEGQLKFARGDLESGLIVARTGLARAQTLGAKEDESRLISLLESLEKANKQ
jgi:tetratricopeptide (TPR) repeat protein